jgi:hypothetical protein
MENGSLTSPAKPEELKFHQAFRRPDTESVQEGGEWAGAIPASCIS